MATWTKCGIDERDATKIRGEKDAELLTDPRAPRWERKWCETPMGKGEIVKPWAATGKARADINEGKTMSDFNTTARIQNPLQCHATHDASHDPAKPRKGTSNQSL